MAGYLLTVLHYVKEITVQCLTVQVLQAPAGEHPGEVISIAWLLADSAALCEEDSSAMSYSTSTFKHLLRSTQVE
jgi:hypothetical protein